MSASYITNTQITPLTLATTYQSLADMFSTLSSISFQRGIDVVITGMAVNQDGSLTVTTADPIPPTISPTDDLGLTPVS